MTKKILSAEPVDSQTVLNQIVKDYLIEQKRKRRWQWVKYIIIGLVLLWIIASFFTMRSEDLGLPSGPHVGMVDLKGTIFDLQSGSADNFIKGLDRAYESKALKALILRIDSPGGSPVQADYMYNAVRFYKKKHPDIKVYALCVDICASAAYYVAASADEIYANPSSLVGSIGVLYNGYGFVDLMQKLGVARRLVISGKNKGFMDAFSPLMPDQEKYMQTMLDLIHERFITVVKEGRGSRLHIDDETFSGLFWTGIQAKERGLIDGFASSGELARDVIKVEQLVDYTYKQSVMERVAKHFGTAVADEIPTALGVKPGFQ